MKLVRQRNNIQPSCTRTQIQKVFKDIAFEGTQRGKRKMVRLPASRISLIMISFLWIFLFLGSAHCFLLIDFTYICLSEIILALFCKQYWSHKLKISTRSFNLMSVFVLVKNCRSCRLDTEISLLCSRYVQGWWHTLHTHVIFWEWHNSRPWNYKLLTPPPLFQKMS